MRVKKSDVEVIVEKTPIDLEAIVSHEDVPQTNKPSAKRSFIKQLSKS